MLNLIFSSAVLACQFFADQRISTLDDEDELQLLPRQVAIRIPAPAQQLEQPAETAAAMTPAAEQEASVVVLGTTTSGKGRESAAVRVELARSGATCSPKEAVVADERVGLGEEGAEALAELLPDIGCTSLAVTVLECILGPTGSASFRVRARGRTSEDLELLACAERLSAKSTVAIISGLPEALDFSFVSESSEQPPALGTGFLRCVSTVAGTDIPSCRAGRPRSVPLIADVNKGLPLRMQVTFVLNALKPNSGVGRNAWLSPSDSCDVIQSSSTVTLGTNAKRTEPVYLCADARGGDYRVTASLSNPLIRDEIPDTSLDVSFGPQPAILRALVAQATPANTGIAVPVELLDCTGTPLTQQAPQIAVESTPPLASLWTVGTTGATLQLPSRPEFIDLSIAGDTCRFEFPSVDVAEPLPPLAGDAGVTP